MKCRYTNETGKYVTAARGISDERECANAKLSGCGGIAWTGPDGALCLMCTMAQEWRMTTKGRLCMV